ncbi:ribonuclease P protein component RnpA [Cupriavidus necator N-1]|uniref:Ribonuclease P protein component n=1 Tax=Cupriavidus necator (strain ATCC 43291 / DSM 13513 / CCUG 52238 / LMG 8453 / N-1) TaxID=1042878 RepID=G0F0V5_CUPNN|nr:ribonuclease P protein component RnpA [Cupriavidus necator N-1]
MPRSRQCPPPRLQVGRPLAAGRRFCASSSIRQRSPVSPSVSAHAFPKAARLTKTDEFSSVFALRPRRRSPHFVLYVRANDRPEGRLGVVVGKKFAPRAAERNLVKRMARELFRQRREHLAGRDVLLRLQAKFPRAEFATRAAVRRACAAEIASLLDVAAKPLPPPAPPASPSAPPPAAPPASPSQSQPPGLPA